MMTLREFTNKIIKPSILKGLKAGALDGTFIDPVCLVIMIQDDELREALVDRLKVLETLK
jgi:hypothetical protein